MKKEVLSFRKIINANTTDVLHERIKADGTIEEIRIRFYTGQQKSLQLNPFVEHKGNKIEQIISYPSTTDNFISGDDDYFIFPISVPVEYDDYFKIHAKNIDPTYNYTVTVDVVIDYLGGKERAGK